MIRKLLLTLALSAGIVFPAFARCETWAPVLGVEYRPGLSITVASEEADVNHLASLLAQVLPEPRKHAEGLMAALKALQHNPAMSREALLAEAGENPRNARVYSARVWCTGFSPSGVPGYALRDDTVPLLWAGNAAVRARKTPTL